MLKGATSGNVALPLFRLASARHPPPQRGGGLAAEPFLSPDSPAHKREESGLPRYSAASTNTVPARGRFSASHTSTRASVSAAICASPWNGEGVMRRRSVPRGTVG